MPCSPSYPLPISSYVTDKTSNFTAARKSEVVDDSQIAQPGADFKLSAMTPPPYSGVRFSLRLMQQFDNAGFICPAHRLPLYPHSAPVTRRVAVCLGTHCNIGSKRLCCPLASDVESSHVISTVYLGYRAVPLQTFAGCSY